ncbi:MAG: type II secretion system secretin GspD [Ketobacteraceae bacterium]|nr:type II secretion system secretin GspD [Ketobacteraceae bacterium]
MNSKLQQWLTGTVLCFGLMLASLSAFAEGNTWKINMKEAEIRNFIEQVSDITGESFVVDPRVKGKVTVVSNADMTAEEIYDMFQSVLRVHGYAAIESGSVIKIVPTQGAKQDNVPVGGGLQNEQMVTRVIPVENTNAVELVPILRPMVPQYGHLAAVTSANALIISDHATNIQRIIDIVKRIDSAESEEVEVIQLEYAWVGDVVELLEQLTPVETGAASKSRRGGSSSARVRVVAEERTNRLILRGEKSARARVKMLVKELDQPLENSGSTQVVYLRHADAVKVAEILNALVTGQRGSSASATPTTSRTRTTRITRRTAGAAASTQADVMIQADETLNALVIRAAPAEIADIKEIISQLDVRRAQVLIEAAVVEITGDSGKAVGIQWGAVDDQSLVGGVNFANVGNSLNAIIQAATSENSNVGLASGLTLGGGSVDDKGRVEFAVILQALNNAANANLLSTPSLMTLDNEEAEIVVGQNVPFVTGSQLSSNNDNPFQTIERKDVGLTLKVTPQINDGDVVRLKVEQETSNVTDTAQAVQATDVVTNKRSINTTVLVNDGSIVALGGLMEESVRSSESKVPLLGDIPLIGMLFRSTQQTHIKTNLLVLLQPTIIRNDAKAAEIVDRKYKAIRAVNMELDDVGNLKVIGEDIYPEDSRDLIRDGLKR